MRHSCGNEMVDIGEWPDFKAGSITHRYHCVSCNEYVSESVAGKKLVQYDEDGLHHWEAVDA